MKIYSQEEINKFNTPSKEAYEGLSKATEDMYGKSAWGREIQQNTGDPNPSEAIFKIVSCDDGHYLLVTSDGEKWTDEDLYRFMQTGRALSSETDGKANKGGMFSVGSASYAQAFDFMYISSGEITDVKIKLPTPKEFIPSVPFPIHLNGLAKYSNILLKIKPGKLEEVKKELSAIDVNVIICKPKWKKLKIGDRVYSKTINIDEFGNEHINVNGKIVLHLSYDVSVPKEKRCKKKDAETQKISLYTPLNFKDNFQLRVGGYINEGGDSPWMLDIPGIPVINRKGRLQSNGVEGIYNELLIDDFFDEKLNTILQQLDNYPELKKEFLKFINSLRNFDEGQDTFWNERVDKFLDSIKDEKILLCVDGSYRTQDESAKFDNIDNKFDLNNLSKLLQINVVDPTYYYDPDFFHPQDLKEKVKDDLENIFLLVENNPKDKLLLYEFCDYYNISIPCRLVTGKITTVSKDGKKVFSQTLSFPNSENCKMNFLKENDNSILSFLKNRGYSTETTPNEIIINHIIPDISNPVHHHFYVAYCMKHYPSWKLEHGSGIPGIQFKNGMGLLVDTSTDNLLCPTEYNKFCDAVHLLNKIYDFNNNKDFFTENGVSEYPLVTEGTNNCKMLVDWLSNKNKEDVLTFICKHDDYYDDHTHREDGSETDWFIVSKELLGDEPMYDEVDEEDEKLAKKKPWHPGDISNYYKGGKVPSELKMKKVPGYLSSKKMKEKWGIKKWLDFDYLLNIRNQIIDIRKKQGYSGNLYFWLKMNESEMTKFLSEANPNRQYLISQITGENCGSDKAKMFDIKAGLYHDKYSVTTLPKEKIKEEHRPHIFNLNDLGVEGKAFYKKVLCLQKQEDHLIGHQINRLAKSIEESNDSKARALMILDYGQLFPTYIPGFSKWKEFIDDKENEIFAGENYISVFPDMFEDIRDLEIVTRILEENGIINVSKLIKRNLKHIGDTVPPPSIIYKRRLGWLLGWFRTQYPMNYNICKSRGIIKQLIQNPVEYRSEIIIEKRRGDYVLEESSTENYWLGSSDMCAEDVFIITPIKPDKFHLPSIFSRIFGIQICLELSLILNLDIDDLKVDFDKSGIKPLTGEEINKLANAKINVEEETPKENAEEKTPEENVKIEWSSPFNEEDSSSQKKRKSKKGGSTRRSKQYVDPRDNPGWANAVKKRCGSKCAVTSTNLKAMCQSAHIIQYRKEDSPEQKANVNNGLYLSHNLHKAYDAGLIKGSRPLITFDPVTLKIVFPPDEKIKKELIKVKIYEDMEIRSEIVTKEMRSFLKIRYDEFLKVWDIT